jgi:phenylalanyl-tRNA synthetase alpha chain
VGDEIGNLEALVEAAKRAIEAASSPQALVEVRAAYLGRRGSLSGVLRGIGGLEAAERARAGERANAAKQEIEACAEARRLSLERSASERTLSEHRLDVTLPGFAPPRGRVHPVTRVFRDVAEFFAGLGFGVEEGPEVETEWHNFDALNMRADHPARDMHDTFHVEGGHVLRTHTSNVQIRAMSGRTPPFRFIAPGRVYRHDQSPRHSPMFHQVEGFAVDERASFAELKGVLYAFLRHLMGADVELRFRASFFPFTEPSAEMDYRCLLCAGQGCATCSQTGWVEAGGCGMIHPVVLSNCGIDPERWQGWAFGMTIDRTAMLRHGIPHIRLLFEGDLRVLEQL